MTDAVIDRIIREMGERGDELEARALAVIQYLYEDLKLAELIEVLRAATELDSPLARLGYADQLLSIFDEVAAELGEPPPQLVQAVRQAVEAGITGTAEMFAASQVVTSAFTVPPTLQLEWMDEAERRMREFWGNEPVRFRQEIHDAIVDGLKRGQGIDQMTKRIKDRVGVSRSRASLIARNEVGNAAAYATKKSQEQAGCTEYIWKSASDRRVRPEHAKRNGKRFRWDDPPPDGHPGEPVNCRCVAIAVIPDKV
ncbi:MAG: minor capsid protein [Deinococcus sp.]|uniref:minor capsid protein n=1 Tax=Deinococcus sp. TaxID=47478 RepID=UPI0026DC3941|nr:minor capsid protein [Deinococcus sp.]MDO4246223.1 minor capsid protein [Deinococcus sp.]